MIKREECDVEQLAKTELVEEKKAEKRLAPTKDVLRELYIHSGNECAMNYCRATLIDSSGTWHGEVAHICAASDNGPRADISLSREERRAAANLMLLCERCHTDIDSRPKDHPVEMLQAIKGEHEGRFRDGLRGALTMAVDEVMLPTSLQYFGLEPGDEECAAVHNDIAKAAEVLEGLSRRARIVLAIAHWNASGGKIRREKLKYHTRHDGGEVSSGDLDGLIEELWDAGLFGWDEDNRSRNPEFYLMENPMDLEFLSTLKDCVSNFQGSDEANGELYVEAVASLNFSIFDDSTC